MNLERDAYATLVRIAALDECRLSHLAAAPGVDVSTTGRHVKRLVEAGDVGMDPRRRPRATQDPG